MRGARIGLAGRLQVRTEGHPEGWTLLAILRRPLDCLDQMLVNGHTGGQDLRRAADTP